MNKIEKLLMLKAILGYWTDVKTNKIKNNNNNNNYYNLKNSMETDLT